MALLPTNSKQVPELAILDQFNKQTYLGNSYIVSSNMQTIPLGNAETPFLLVSNPSTNAHPVPTGLFQNLRKLIVGTNDGTITFATFRFYLNPTVLTPGTPLTPGNLRPGILRNSIMTSSLNPTVTGVAQVQTITTVASTSGSLNNTFLLLSSTNASGVQKDWYLWFNVNSTGTDPAVSGRTGIEVDIAAGTVSANAVATAMRSALNALTGDFVATGATNVVIITNAHTGSATLASDGSQPTGFTFVNTTPGDSAFGTFIAVLEVSLTEVDSSLLFVLDPGYSMLVTVTTVTDASVVACELSWQEI